MFPAGAGVFLMVVVPVPTIMVFPAGAGVFLNKDV